MTSVTECGSIQFSFYRPDAKDVKLAGTFNNWQARGYEMTPIAGGWWTATLGLAAGEYRFRYVADGNWFTDFAANGVELTKRGWNSILMVAERGSESAMRIDRPLEQGPEQYTTDAIAA